jgi:hypothetical protein
MSDTKSKGGSGEKQLTADQVAVKQLVTVVPEPRTSEELAQRYDGLRRENLWPEQSESSVKARITELVGDGVLKEGAEAPNGEPTIELA